MRLYRHLCRLFFPGGITISAWAWPLGRVVQDQRLEASTFAVRDARDLHLGGKQGKFRLTFNPGATGTIVDGFIFTRGRNYAPPQRMIIN